MPILMLPNHLDTLVDGIQLQNVRLGKSSVFPLPHTNSSRQPALRRTNGHMGICPAVPRGQSCNPMAEQPVIARICLGNERYLAFQAPSLFIGNVTEIDTLCDHPLLSNEIGVALRIDKRIK